LWFKRKKSSRLKQQQSIETNPGIR